MSSRAVDNSFTSGTCTQRIQRNEKQHWYVDLGKSYDVKFVTIFHSTGISYRFAEVEFFLTKGKPPHEKKAIFQAQFLCDRVPSEPAWQQTVAVWSIILHAVARDDMLLFKWLALIQLAISIYWKSMCTAGT